MGDMIRDWSGTDMDGTDKRMIVMYELRRKTNYTSLANSNRNLDSELNQKEQPINNFLNLWTTEWRTISRPFKWLYMISNNFNFLGKICCLIFIELRYTFPSKKNPNYIILA